MRGSEQHVRINPPPKFGNIPAEPLALFAALLYRYSGQEQIAFEIISSNNGEDFGVASTRETIQIDFTDDPGFAVLIRRLGTAFGHLTMSRLSCFVPEDLCRTLSRARNDDAIKEAQLKFDWRDVAGHLEPSIAYEPNIYDDRTILVLARHFEKLLKSALDQPEMPISQLEMMSEKELHQILVEQNGGTIEFERQTIPDAFEQQVSKSPNAPALIYLGQTITYRQLQLRTYQLAASLQNVGVAPETLIGVYLDDPLAIATMYLAIVIAGGVLVALDPEWPKERLEQVITEAAMPFVVTSAERGHDIPHGNHRLLALETLESLGHNATLQKTNFTPDYAAYVVFTSGSTGTPKGIVGLHRTITSMPKVTRPLRSDEILAPSANLTFGAGVAGLFFPLLQGAAVLLVPRTIAQDLPALVRAWEAAGVTRIVLVAPQLRQLALLGADISNRLKNVTTVALAGATLTPETLLTVYELFPRAMVINAYTCLEVGTMTTRWETMPEDRTRPVTVGRALPNIRVYILGPKLNPLPSGMPGEIYVGSADLSRGYLNRPDLTRERFLPNPFGVPGISRLYRTGDVGRFLDNGEIEYLGRVDNQVKVRGIRIELEEIEAALQSYNEVHQAVVIAISEDGDSRLVAFVSGKPGSSLSATALRQYLGGRLPTYMVPALFVLMDALPMTGNGKIDRQRLPKVGASRPEMDVKYAPMRNDLEESLAAIWKREFRMNSIGADDDFYELGGDSLLAVRIVIAIQEQLGCEVPVVSVFEHPTVRSLATELESRCVITDAHSLRPF